MARILIIDDNLDVRLFHRALLELDGYEIIEARPGPSARRYLRDAALDAVVCELCELHDEDCRLLAEFYENNPSLMIIVNTFESQYKKIAETFDTLTFVSKMSGFSGLESVVCSLVASDSKLTH